MIEPHGGVLVDRILEGGHAAAIRETVENGPTIDLDWNQFQNTINIATGRFSPLDGFLGRNEFRKVVHDLTLEDGTVWPLPITLDVDAGNVEGLDPPQKVGLRSPDGNLVGVIDVDEIYRPELEKTVESVFGTADESHPGVTTFLDQESFFIGGDVALFDKYRYNGKDLLPTESRMLFDHRGWETVVGFQTRNAPHRAHEYMQKSALERTDGLLVQPKLGHKKVDDYLDEAIVGGYEVLIENYYPPDRIALSVFPSKMWYAGPREAVFDALVRKNQGCTHFVVGRDHAGVADYYGEFDAQRLFEEIGDIGIETVFYDYSLYCERCDGMTSKKVCPHDGDEQVSPSGSEIRRLIRENRRPSEKVMRPEVADYLMNHQNPFVSERGVSCE